MRLGKAHCDDLYRGIMIHPPSPRHRKDGGPHEGGGEKPVSAARRCSCCCPNRGSSVEYGKFKPEAQPCQVSRHGCTSFKNAGVNEAPEDMGFTFMPFLFDLRVKEESHKSKENGGIIYDRHPNEKRDKLQKISVGAGTAASFWADHRRTSRKNRCAEPESFPTAFGAVI